MSRSRIKQIPVLGPLITKIYGLVKRPYRGSEDYWIKRYQSGGTSGSGSYKKLAVFKAEVLNSLVEKYAISSIIEFGCGDGNQLTLARYPKYIGFDISPIAIEKCRRLFKNDPTKQFKLQSEYAGEKGDLSLSLDVVYHLTEDAVYISYMNTLFDAAEKLVIIYSSNTNENPPSIPSHIKHRKFTDWIEQNQPDWTLTQRIPNRYPRNEFGAQGSLADFYCYEKRPVYDTEKHP